MKLEGTEEIGGRGKGCTHLQMKKTGSPTPLDKKPVFFICRCGLADSSLEEG